MFALLEVLKCGCPFIFIMISPLPLHLCVQIQRKSLENNNNNAQTPTAPSRGKTLPTPVQYPPQPSCRAHYAMTKKRERSRLGVISNV